MLCMRLCHGRRAFVLEVNRAVFTSISVACDCSQPVTVQGLGVSCRLRVHLPPCPPPPRAPLGTCSVRGECGGVSGCRAVCSNLTDEDTEAWGRWPARGP